jgi:hypothetical protein
MAYISALFYKDSVKNIVNHNFVQPVDNWLLCLPNLNEEDQSVKQSKVKFGTTYLSFCSAADNSVWCKLIFIQLYKTSSVEG